MKVEIGREYIEPSRMDLDYDYPVKGLKPGDDLHEFLVEYVRERVILGRAVKDGHANDWREMEWTQQAFVPEQEAKTKGRGKKGKKNASEGLNLHVPLSLSTLHQACAYHHAVFLADPPIHKYSSDAGVVGKISAGLHERVQMKIDLQLGNVLALDGQIRDAYLYGGGHSCHGWYKRRADTVQSEKVDLITQAILMAQHGVDMPLDTVVKTIEEGRIIAEGTKDRNLNPWYVIRDPSVNSNDIQDAEFFGFVDVMQNAMLMVQRETDPEEMRFNGKAVKMLAECGLGRSEWWFSEETGQDARSKDITNYMTGSFTGDTVSHRVDEVTLFVRLIPSETGPERQKLGDSNRPEVWCISCAADRIITQCHKLNYRHGDIPITCMSPMNAVHEIMPTSHIAITYPFQKYLNLRMNASARNTLKTANNTTIVNQWLVDMDAVLNSQEGGIWPMTELAMEMGADKVAYQLPVQDLSGATLNESAAIQGMCKDALGINQTVGGDLSGLPERPGQSGVGAAVSRGDSRLEREARIMDAQAFQRRAKMVAWNNAQFLENPIWVRMAGKYGNLLSRTFGSTESIPVTKDMLDIDFDVVPTTGRLSPKNDPTPVNQIVQLMMANPILAQEFATRFPNSIMAIFFQWCLKNGFEDIEEIAEAADKMTVTVSPEEDLMAQQDAGNVIAAQDAFSNVG